MSNKKWIIWYKVWLLFIPFYIAFGVVWPTKMSLINNILMSVVNIGMFYISNSLIVLSLMIRSALGI